MTRCRVRRCRVERYGGDLVLTAGRPARRSRLKPRLGASAEAAERRQFTDTCRVAGSPADSGGDELECAFGGHQQIVDLNSTSAAPRSRLKPRLGASAEAAERRQFTDTC